MSGKSKSLGMAYVLLVVLGVFGAHRFYLRRWWSGAGYVVLAMLTFVALFFFLAAVPLAVIVLWLLVDMMLLPRMVRRGNASRAGEAA